MRGRLGIIICGLSATIHAAPAAACTPRIDWPDPNAPEARAQAAYEAASPQERRRINQENYWNSNPYVFIARIERPVMDAPTEVADKTELTVTADTRRRGWRRIQITPLVWIKGTAQPLEASYQIQHDVVPNCIPESNQSYLGKAQYGELVIIYARPTWRAVDGKPVQDGLGLFAIDADQAVDPRLTEALSSIPR